MLRVKKLISGTWRIKPKLACRKATVGDLFIVGINDYGAFSHDVTAAILEFQVLLLVLLQHKMAKQTTNELKQSESYLHHL